MITLVNNTAEIRSLNTKKIINYLRYSQPITKKELADRLCLSFATVSNICNALLKEGIVEKVSSKSSSGGRIPELLSINPFSKYYLCLNIMNKNVIEIALLNFISEVIEMKSYNISGNETLDILIEILNKLKNELLNSRNIEDKDVLGMGVAAAGIYNKRNQYLIKSNNSVYENKNLKFKLNEAFNLPVIIENDANLLVLATSEYYQKEIKNSDVIYLYIGEGFGSGIISEGKIIVGRNGLGGETGHLPLGNRDYQCHCGNCGCIESELSLKGFLRKYQELKRVENAIIEPSWEEFESNVILGEEKALSVIAENGKLLGKLISILINVFGTEDFYIGGITEKIFPYLYPHIDEELKKRIFVNELSVINIYNSVNYEKLIFRGCSEIIFNEWTPQI